jgi:MFS family permease
VYSAWAPQFADRLLLSATESNLIGLFGNLGMYSMGVPVGIMIDTRGPRPAVIIGSILLGVGYWPLHNAYNSASGSVPLMCFYSFLTGLGGCTAFAAAVKTSALNWPHHRGTATAFPLAAFGLSAFFFSLIGSIAFPGDPGPFLELLAAGTFGMTFVGFFFLRVFPHSHVYHSHYHTVNTADSSGDLVSSRELRRTPSHESKSSRLARRSTSAEPSMSYDTTTSPGGEASQGSSSRPLDVEAADEAVEELNETSSLMSRSSSASSLPGDVLLQSSVDLDHSHRVDIRGWNLLRNVEFWQLFSIMGILSGIGLMTIK